MKTFHHVKGVPTLWDMKTVEENGVRHYIDPFGGRYPSITTVLGHFKKQKINEWRKRVGEDTANSITRKASIRGTKLHSLVQTILENKPIDVEGPVMPDMRQALLDMQKELDKIDNIYYIEAALHSQTLGVAGRVDLIAEYDGVLSVIDFKTSLKPKREEYIKDYFEQAAGYACMCEEQTGIVVPQTVIIISVDHEPVPQVFINCSKKHLPGLKDKIREYRLHK